MNFRGQVQTILDKASYEGSFFREDSRTPKEIAEDLLRETINRLCQLEPLLMFDIIGIEVELQFYHHYDIIYINYIGVLEKGIKFTLVTKLLKEGLNSGIEIINNIRNILSQDKEIHFVNHSNVSFEAYLRLKA